MTTVIQGHSEKTRGPLWDRPDGLGLAVSMLGPLLAVLVGNGLLFAAGGMENPDYTAVAWGPPGWLIGTIWCVIYPLWGAARWKTATADDPRAGRSWWLVALIVWGLAYPVVTAFVDTLGSVIANGFSLALAVAAVVRVWPVSTAAALLTAPSIVWLSIANALGLSALQAAG